MGGNPEHHSVCPSETGLVGRHQFQSSRNRGEKVKRTWTVYSPPDPALSTSKLENFSNIYPEHVSKAKNARGERGRTFPVFPILFVTFSSFAGLWGNNPGIEPPVAYQLQNADVMYRFASSRWSVLPHPSPFVALPPFTTVPFSVLISAPGPEALALPAFVMGCSGSWFSERPSWPEGTRLKVFWPEEGVGRGDEVTLLGRAFNASRAMYWCGGQAFGASLLGED